MEINSIQNCYHQINTTTVGHEKKTAEDSTTSPTETYGTDTVEISHDGNFKSELGTYSKAYETHSKQDASQERIEQLKVSYAGDNCPVSGTDIATAIMKYTFGKTGQESIER